MTDTATTPRRLLGGRYELGPLIGQGTFGRVFRGYDRRLARPVAVKVIKPWWTEEPEWAERFEREAQMMARINDPGIVQIHDIGFGEDGLYYVAELVEGESLADRLSRGPLSPRHALDLAAQLCRALVPAHAQRIVHRDIKPANVLIGRGDRVKVGDFGVARLADGTSEGPAGTILGTPRYMAPEQARGELPTPATDVYGAGVVLYEMLAGEPPFTERSAVELALRHIGDPPPPLPAHVPPALGAVVDRALAKHPAERYPSALEMAEALEAARPAVATADVLATPPRRATPPGPTGTRVAPRRSPRRDVNPPESRRYRALLAGVLLLLAGLITGAILMAGGGTARVPALRGLSQAAARTRLLRLDLKASFARHYSSAPVGTVIGQQPSPADKVSQGSTVSATLSAGPPPVPVPNVTGQSTAAAEAILSRSGLHATVAAVPAPGVAAGLVVGQSPSATTSVSQKSTVALSVAEVPRWRPLTSFSGSGSGRSVPFRIRGSRWRMVYGMNYNGMCTFIFFCSGPSATVTNVTSGATVNQFDLSQGSGQTQVFHTGPGVYQISISPGSDSAGWSIQAEDDY
ncbi:MAG TPA: protein kinase [Solirubrobacteraceae bacterium]|nr:protein kinase [Solirubrobacteraceae bacterium]